MSEVVIAGLVVLLAVLVRSARAADRRVAVAARLVVATGGPGPRRVPLLAAAIDHLPDPPAWVAPALHDADIDIAPALAWWAWMATVVTGAIAGLMAAGVGLAGVLAGVLVAAPLAAVRARRGQGDRRLEAELPEALETIARALRSGESLRQAVVETGEATPGRLGAELSRAGREASFGVPLAQALDAMAARRPVPGVRLMVAALSLGAETGGAQARAIDGVAATLRDRLSVAAEVKALAAQARLSALVIGIAPLAFGMFAITTDPRTGQFLFGTPAGIALLTAGLLLDGAGWLWMRRVTRVAA